MKILRLVLISLGAMMILTSCEKDVPPSVEITVVDTLKQRVPGAFVQLSVQGAQGGVIDSTFLQTQGTDDFGKAFFNFKHTVLVDVFLVDGVGKVDSVSILAETKRKRGSNPKNVYERTLVKTR